MASKPGIYSSKNTFGYWLNQGMRIAVFVLGFGCLVMSMISKLSWLAGSGVVCIVVSLFYDRIVRLKWLGGEAEFSPAEKIIGEVAEQGISVIEEHRDRVINATSGLANHEAVVEKANQIADEAVSKVDEVKRSVIINVPLTKLSVKTFDPVVNGVREISDVTSGTISELSTLLPRDDTQWTWPSFPNAD
jgi:hypothetical protein